MAPHEVEVLEESHESLWSSMDVTVVRDGAPPRARQTIIEDSSDSDSEGISVKAKRMMPRRCDRRAAVALSLAIQDGADHHTGDGEIRASLPEQCSDSDGSTSESAGSAPCRTVDLRGVDGKEEVTFGDLVDDEGGAAVRGPLHSPLEFEGTLVGDLEGVARRAGGTDGHMLPSVKTAQQQLQGITTRRSVINSISSKYSPMKGATSFKSAVPLFDTQVLGPEMLRVQVAEDMSLVKPAVTGTAQQEPNQVDTPSPCHGATLPKPARISGPCARPNREQIADVMRQLGAGLGRLAAQPQSAQQLPSGYSSGFTAIVDVNTSSEAVSAKCSISITSTNAVNRDHPAKTACQKHADVDASAKRYQVDDDHSDNTAGTNACARATEHTDSVHTWPVDDNKLQVGRNLEMSRMEELWHQFLGSDDPVGSDLLPTPECYYGGTASGGS